MTPDLAPQDLGPRPGSDRGLAQVPRPRRAIRGAAPLSSLGPQMGGSVGGVGRWVIRNPGRWQHVATAKGTTRSHVATGVPNWEEVGVPLSHPLTGWDKNPPPWSLLE